MSYAPLPAGGCTSTHALLLPGVPVEEIVNHAAISTALFNPVARQTTKLIHYNKHDKGGHFAAWEQPELFSEEVRAGFRPLRK